jgi:hypothetical protein
MAGGKRGGRMKDAFTVWIGFLWANFAYQWTFDGLWLVALERSWFQLLPCLIVGWVANKRPE